MCIARLCHMTGHVQMEAMGKMKNISELLHSKHYRDRVRSLHVCYKNSRCQVHVLVVHTQLNYLTCWIN